MEGWLRRRAGNRRMSPKDGLDYIVCQEVVDFTIQVLCDYGRRRPAAEGVVYWAGRLQGKVWQICAAVAPAVQASRYGFQTGYSTNARFVSFLCDNNLQYIAQVHSHPGSYVDHSPVDDQETAFRREGLLSIVVPNFGSRGILPWKQCGVHLFTNNCFRRITDKHLRKHFCVVDAIEDEILIKNFRNE